MLSYKKKIMSLLEGTDIEINGDRPWDIQVYNENLYPRVIKGGTLAFGEAYMDGWWGAKRLDRFFEKVFESGLDTKVKSLSMLPYYLKSLFSNPQKGEHAFDVAKVHYDIGNDLYSLMLDKRMTYSCGYWDAYGNRPEATDLDSAQENKLDMICQKLGIKPRDRILDIGCGWGSFIRYAAEKYGAHCVGISVSKEQVKLGNETKGDLPIEFRLQDYRTLNEKEPFDHIVSVGMFEHVGPKNYKEYMEVVEKNLKDGGLFLLHTIGVNTSANRVDPWVHKYIFPNSVLPSAAQIFKAAEGHFVAEDLHNFGTHYDRTLMAWYENFKKGWPKIKDKYGERFYRMWEYYLLSFAALFRTRELQVWQIVFSKKRKEGYKRQY